MRCLEINVFNGYVRLAASGKQDFLMGDHNVLHKGLPMKLIVLHFG